MGAAHPFVLSAIGCPHTMATRSWLLVLLVDVVVGAALRRARVIFGCPGKDDAVVGVAARSATGPFVRGCAGADRAEFLASSRKRSIADRSPRIGAGSGYPGISWPQGIRARDRRTGSHLRRRALCAPARRNPRRRARVAASRR
jgi:hypothetical protein